MYRPNLSNQAGDFVIDKQGATLSEIFEQPKPIIGMVHLKPLPGSPGYDPDYMSFERVTEIAVEEAIILEEGGVDGLQIENIWDFPYLKGEDIGPETAAALAIAAERVRKAVGIPIGINCHLNGGFAALAAAIVVGAKWIRVFEWVNAYVSHAGLTEGIGGKLARYRANLRAQDVKFFCDVNVKHGSHFIISDRSVSEQAHDAESEGAELLIVTGFETGKAPSAERVEEFKKSVGLPVLLGSGTTAENVGELLKHADGAIVGSYFKQNNDWRRKIERERVERFMTAVSAARSSLT